MKDDLSQLKDDFPDPWAEIQRLTALVEDLQRQLKQALDGNKEQRELLKDLQQKLDVLIAQSKKGKRKKYGKQTEQHNPRPAPATKKESGSNTNNEKSAGIKHIIENAVDLPHEPVPGGNDPARRLPHHHLPREARRARQADRADGAVKA